MILKLNIMDNKKLVTVFGSDARALIFVCVSFLLLIFVLHILTFQQVKFFSPFF